MGANCGKEEASNSKGFSSSTAQEVSIKRIASDLGGGEGKGKENEMRGINPALSQPKINRSTSEKTTKALKGKALLAACMMEDGDSDDEKFVDFNDDKANPNVPGLIADSPTATERERRAEKKRNESPNNSGSRRRSKRFEVKDKGGGTGSRRGGGGEEDKAKALKGKALMQACMMEDDDWSDDD
ncbi:hypothetical protein TrST_g3683 [Triparma strigata]|uniref:Uncharacterized protein n=1 Tax=Triparma strigata TaxID=1606541 RepID=A0A9W6ZPJ4_9STRA|nr:hypothetical protein TrST_g3683 [Triparma strigata]